MENTKELVGFRFDELVKVLGYSIPSFAKALGYERCDKLYNIQKGKYYPSFEILQDITKYFVSVNVDWIISGRGSMFFTNSNGGEKIDIGNNLTTDPATSVDESIIYKMYKELLQVVREEKVEKEELLKENGRLEERFRILNSSLLATCDDKSLGYRVVLENTSLLPDVKPKNKPTV